MKRNSWHYRLAKMGNQDQRIWSGDMSICEYTRKVIFGGILFTFIMCMLGLLVWFIGTALYEIIGAIFGFAVLGPAAACFIGMIIALGSIVLYFKTKDVLRDTARRVQREEPNSYFSKAYKAYKEKVCFAVEFEDDK
jgi:hypothetical protein